MDACSTSFQLQIDELIFSLDQIDSLLTIGMYSNINIATPKMVLNYFQIASDILNRAKRACEKLEKIF